MSSQYRCQCGSDLPNLWAACPRCGEDPTKNRPGNDPVNHPAHYTRGKIEVLTFIEDQGLGYHLGQVIKYVCRAGHKDPATYKEDLRKAAFYLQREIDRVPTV